MEKGGLVHPGPHATNLVTTHYVIWAIAALVI